MHAHLKRGIEIVFKWNLIDWKLRKKEYNLWYFEVYFLSVNRTFGKLFVRNVIFKSLIKFTKRTSEHFHLFVAWKPKRHGKRLKSKHAKYQKLSWWNQSPSHLITMYHITPHSFDLNFDRKSGKIDTMYAVVCVVPSNLPTTI